MREPRYFRALDADLEKFYAFARHLRCLLPPRKDELPVEVQQNITELVDRILEARRPRAACHAVHMDFKDIETSRLKRLLRDVATVNSEPAAHFKLDRYYISEALNSLGRMGVTRDEMAQLEFFFIDALDHGGHGMPNLESQIAKSPV